MPKSTIPVSYTHLDVYKRQLLLGAAAMAAQYGLAGAAARWWLGDVRAAGALRVSAFGMPWMALSAVLRGFFIARRRVEPNVLSQLAEQTVRIGVVLSLIHICPGGRLRHETAVAGAG